MSLRSERRKLQRRGTLSGYPVAGVLSKQEVLDYFSEETIVCLLCGRRLKRLAGHIPRIHGVTEDEYREKYGLPYGHGLLSAASYRKYRSMWEDRIAHGQLAETPPPEVTQRAQEASRYQRTSRYKQITSDENLGEYLGKPARPRSARGQWEKV